MNSKNLYLMLAFLLSLSFIMCSCKTKSKLIKESKQESIQQIVAKAKATDIKFTSANIANASIRVKYEKNDFTFKSAIQIIPDSMISVSLMPALGIEIVRLNLYKNKFQVIDKFNRRYAENDYNYLSMKHALKIDYKTIENIVCNKAFPIATNNDYKNWNMKLQNDSIIITDNSRIFNLFNIETILNSNYRTINISAGNDITKYAKISFSEFKETDNTILPSKYELKTTIPNDMYCLVHIKRIRFNTKSIIYPLNLSKYKRVTFNEIMPF